MYKIERAKSDPEKEKEQKRAKKWYFDTLIIYKNIKQLALNQYETFNLNVRIKSNSLFKRTAGGCLLRSSPGLSGRVTPAEPKCTNLHGTQAKRFFKD